MANLESKATKVTIVIRKNIECSISTLNGFCEFYFKRYAYIKHEKDVSPKGVVEGVHYHIVGELKERTRLGTLLNRLTAYFGFDSPFGIEIDTAKCIEACYQYLIHKNDKDKTPHDISEIVSNIPQEELKTIIETAMDTSITPSRLEDVLRSNIRFDRDLSRCVVNYFGIIEALGIGRCNACSWALNAGIKQVKNELYRMYGVAIPNEY